MASESAEYFSQTRREMLPFVPQRVSRTLDVGCGEGVFSGELKKFRNIEAWGVEISDAAGKVAERRLDRILYGSFEETYENLPRSYFDCIFFNDVLEHILDPYSALQMAIPLLAEDGVIICSIPNVRYFPQLIELLIEKDWRYKDSGILDRTHVRFFTLKSIKRMFDENGLKIELIKGINPIMSLKKRCLCHIANVATIGLFHDCYYQQYACVIKAET